MPSRKQADDTMDGGSSSSPALLLQRIRNMWEFANLCQWIYIFGKAVKIDESLEIDVRDTIPVILSDSTLTAKSFRTWRPNASNLHPLYLPI